jgi:hypothetical protein
MAEVNALDRLQTEILRIRVAVQAMHISGKVLRSFKFPFDKCLVDDHLRCDILEFRPHASTCFRTGSKLCCILSTPTEMQSISENDFECLANTVRKHAFDNVSSQHIPCSMPEYERWIAASDHVRKPRVSA